MTASFFAGYASVVLGLTNFVNLSVIFTIAVSVILSNFFLIIRILGKQILGAISSTQSIQINLKDSADQINESSQSLASNANE